MDNTLRVIREYGLYISLTQVEKENLQQKLFARNIPDKKLVLEFFLLKDLRIFSLEKFKQAFQLSKDYDVLPRDIMSTVGVYAEEEGVTNFHFLYSQEETQYKLGKFVHLNLKFFSQNNKEFKLRSISNLANAKEWMTFKLFHLYTGLPTDPAVLPIRKKLYEDLEKALIQDKQVYTASLTGATE